MPLPPCQSSAHRCALLPPRRPRLLRRRRPRPSHMLSATTSPLPLPPPASVPAARCPLPAALHESVRLPVRLPVIAVPLSPQRLYPLHARITHLCASARLACGRRRPCTCLRYSDVTTACPFCPASAPPLCLLRAPVSVLVRPSRPPSTPTPCRRTHTCFPSPSSRTASISPLRRPPAAAWARPCSAPP
jgi:hypothetical protein